MLRVLTDQNFNGRVLRGLRRRVASLDVVRASESFSEADCRDQVIYFPL